MIYCGLSFLWRDPFNRVMSLKDHLTMKQPDLQAASAQPLIYGNRKRLFLIGFIGSMLVFLCLGGFFLLGGIALSSLFGDPPLTVDIPALPPIQVGELFTLPVTVTNDGDRALTLTEVQLPKILLEGAELTGSTPPSAGTTDYTGQVGYDFSLSLAPQETTTLIFQLKAIRQGEYTADVGVRSGRRIRRAPLHVVIRP